MQTDAEKPAQAHAASGAHAPAPAGFTLGLALLDAVPVLLFCASMVLVGLRFRSALFAAGAVCCVLAGCGKVAWKLLAALRGADISWLARPFRVLMPAGFALMLVAVVAAIAGGTLAPGTLYALITRMPACACFVLALACFAAMGIMGATLGRRDARANWAEQLVNTCAQLALLAGIALC